MWRAVTENPSPSPGLSVRGALEAVRASGHDDVGVSASLRPEAVAEHFATRFGGVPATSVSRPEPVVVYWSVAGSALPVLLGLYGDAARVRSWLPGLPKHIDVAATARLLAGCHAPIELSGSGPCHEVVLDAAGFDALPVLRATDRDAGPFLTMGVVCTVGDDARDTALSVHRMLVLDSHRATLWMLPSRQLRAAYERARGRGERLALTVNVGAPPAAVVASATASRFLPEGVRKLDLAGALAGGPVRLVRARTQPAWALADSEVVLEGHLDGTTHDEARTGPPAASLPEFLGYDGRAQPGLPVMTVTGVSTRRSAVYQAAIGPGREQSVVLGLAGELSVALSADGGPFDRLVDLHLSPAGGGMLLLVAAVRKTSSHDDLLVAELARRLFARHPFVKLLVVTDPDVDPRNPEDVWWAVTTRSNLGTDATTSSGHSRLAMDPSQAPDWGRGGVDCGGTRTVVDATTPYALRGRTRRSFG